MDFLLDFILHIDQYMIDIVQEYHMWAYAILFLIIFCETGLVVTPFLPGDSLLFVAGAIAALPDMPLEVNVLALILFVAAVLPLEGVIAETAGAFTLYLTEYLKIPVSTTHTITGAIIGVGATKRLSAVRWGVTKSLMTAWVLTIPVSALLAAGIYCIVSLF